MQNRTDSSRLNPLASLISVLAISAVVTSAATSPAWAEASQQDAKPSEEMPIPTPKPKPKPMPKPVAQAPQKPTATADILTGTQIVKSGKVATIGDETSIGESSKVASEEPPAPDLCTGGAIEYDCNGNGVNDLCDIAHGWADLNENGILDRCEEASGDLDLDGMVGPRDLAMVLVNWNGEGHDANGDGIVNSIDLAIVLSNWSPLG